VVDGVLQIVPHASDPAPARLLRNIPASINHRSRIARPLIRRGWLEDGPGPDERRGRDDYVELEWDEALDIAAAELQRLGAGGDATGEAGRKVFGGSYGWSSAGRFHHAQSQVHRFLNTAFGGYVRSVETYSSAAGAVILDYVLADSMKVTRDRSFWDELADETEMILAFGGLPTRNSMVSSGGNSRHVAPGSLAKAAARGAEFVLVSPVRDDLPVNINCRWVKARPATDVALMLGIACHLSHRGLVDRAFLDRCTVGYDRFEDYLLGRSDGVPKTPEWAAAIAGVDAATIRAIAERAAERKTLITVTYSLQRAQHGEQPIWMGLVLAAMLGQMGQRGCGYSYGLGSIGNVGKPLLDVPLPTLPQGRNNVPDFIPVSRIADLLLNPGGKYTYRGETRTYADIRLVYWAGGNPFHHHQDLTRLRSAFARPDTIILHEASATATARHADIVFPATTSLERKDIGAAGNDPLLIAMDRLSTPFGEARDDYDIFADLARRLGCDDRFTEGLTSSEWLRRLYEPTRTKLAAKGLHAPDFEQFWSDGEIQLPTHERPGIVQSFCNDPDRNPLPTASGRIEIFSEKIAGYNLPDCLGHPAWIAPDEWLGSDIAERFPLQLVANQPSTRLHSQLDYGAESIASKIRNREPVRMNPADAVARGIGQGDLVRLFNERGSTIAAAVVTNDVMQGVVQLSTGAWFSPAEGMGKGLMCLHGNPNAVTRDIGTSSLSQGCAGQLSLVQIEAIADVPDPDPHSGIRANRPDAALRNRIDLLRKSKI
jgi:biotin/methionine sulfoxide reductase